MSTSLADILRRRRRMAMDDLYVCPRFSSQNTSNGRFRNPKESPQFPSAEPSSFEHLSHFCNFILCHLGRVNLFSSCCTFWFCMASVCRSHCRTIFSNPVCNVVINGSREEMRWVDANFIVALVANIQYIPSTRGKKERNPVCLTLARTKADSPVAIMECTSSPYPAIVRSFSYNLGVKLTDLLSCKVRWDRIGFRHSLNHLSCCV